MPGPRKGTVLPNGPMIIRLRTLRGWSREDLEWQTHLVVEELAKKELNRRGRISKRCIARRGKTKLAGIGLTTLASIEKSNPAFPFTIKIVAEALGVEMHTLIHPHDPFCLT